MKENQTETGVYKEKPSNTENYTFLHLSLKAVYWLGLWHSKLDLRQHWSSDMGVVLHKAPIRRSIEMLCKWAIDVLNTVY